MGHLSTSTMLFGQFVGSGVFCDCVDGDLPVYTVCLVDRLLVVIDRRTNNIKCAFDISEEDLARPLVRSNPIECFSQSTQPRYRATLRYNEASASVIFKIETQHNPVPGIVEYIGMESFNLRRREPQPVSYCAVM